MTTNLQLSVVRIPGGYACFRLYEKPKFFIDVLGKPTATVEDICCEGFTLMAYRVPSLPSIYLNYLELDKERLTGLCYGDWYVCVYENGKVADFKYIEDYQKSYSKVKDWLIDVAKTGKWQPYEASETELIAREEDETLKKVRALLAFGGEGEAQLRESVEKIFDYWSKQSRPKSTKKKPKKYPMYIDTDWSSQDFA